MLPQQQREREINEDKYVNGHICLCNDHPRRTNWNDKRVHTEEL